MNTRRHVRTLYISAGIDTSRLTLYFALRYMAGYQDIQSKVQEELDSVVGEYLLHFGFVFGGL